MAKQGMQWLDMDLLKGVQGYTTGFDSTCTYHRGVMPNTS